jgi:hypothetical protein
MNEKKLYSYRLYFTGLITIAIWSLLIWSHYHGGVTSHHLLHREELPAISNWWSGLLIPLLTWFLSYRIQKRVFQNKGEHSNVSKPLITIVYGFFAALLYGVLVSIFFTYDIASVPGYMLLGILVIALFYPIYRAECILGFVLGMTIIFGAFIPTIVAGIFSLPGILLYRLIRPTIIYLSANIFRKASLTKHQINK